MPDDEATRVAIVEDDRRTREGLAQLIDGSPGFRCVGAYASVEHALQPKSAPTPEVILLDLNLPGLSGAEGVPKLLELHPGVLILMLTVYEDEDKVFQSLCGGAVGYLVKKTPPARLLEAIQEAKAGGAPMSPEIARKVVRLLRKTPIPRKSAHDLTPQELRLLALLAEGYSYQSAGESLHVSVNTVRNYIRSIYGKLRVHSKSEAVSRSLREGLI
jgi:DNA-binding NarL/FixJ family response regulator